MANPTDQNIYEFGGFRLDAGHLMLSRDDAELPLAPKAVETLLALVQRRGEIVSKDELLDAVWPGTAVEESNLFLYLSVLRKTLDTQPNGDPWIETLRRRGYRFVGAVRVKQSATEDKYAWIVDSPDPDEANINTQSGRIYVLKDWRRGRSGSAAHASKPREIPREASPPSTGPEKKQSLESSVAATKLHRGGMRRIAAWAATAGAALAVFASVYLVIRSRDDAAESRSEISTTPLTTGVDVQVAAISRDGTKFAFADEAGRVFLQQVGQQNPTEIFARSGINTLIGFSPDGKFIYYTVQAAEDHQLSLYRLPALGGQPKQIRDRIFRYSAISFSPDGSQVVFADDDPVARRSSIVISNADGTGEREILASSREWLTYPSWSRDGKLIAFARVRPLASPKDQFVSLETVSVDGGSPSLLISEKLSNCFRIEWTSNDKGIVFAGTRLGDHLSSRRDQIWYAGIQDGRLSRITAEGDRYWLGGLTADDQAIAISLRRSSQLWAIDSDGDTSSEIQLTRGTTDGRTGIAPLPDGRVGYLSRNGDGWEIWTVNGDDSNPSQVFTGNPIIDELRATPDGRYFVFNGDVNRHYQLFKVETDGTGVEQMTSDESLFVGDSSPSSDGRSIIFTGTSYAGETALTALYRISIDGGEPAKVDTASKGPFNPHNSPDGRYISYVDHEKVPARIVVQSLADSSSRSFDVPGTTQLNMGAVWAPDSRSFAYVVFAEKAANVWLQPIDGGPPRKLTKFSGGKIFRIAYSSDGKRLYLARGYSVNEAVLIKGFAN